LNRTRSILSRMTAKALTAVVVAALPMAAAVHVELGPGADEVGSPGRTSAHWVNTWVSMPQLTEPGNMPPGSFTQQDRVLAHCGRPSTPPSAAST
jgi:hypothetical protein